MMHRTHAHAVAAILSGLTFGCAEASSSDGPAPSQDAGGSDVLEAAVDSMIPFDTGPVDGDHDGAWCGGETVPAELVPLDLYVMLDASGSMSREISGTFTKWDAVTQALNDFVADPSMDRLNLGLQLFPYLRPQVPMTCTAVAQCNGFGPCTQPRICDNHYFGGTVVACTSADDCVSGSDTGSCLPQGFCAGEQNLVCLPEFESVCKNNLGECLVVPAACEGRQSCDAEDYASPAVPIGPRPDVVTPVVDALAARTPEGATPTGPALQGAIAYLQDRLASYPDHRAAVVLVTDGLPTDCTPVDIDDIAAVAGSAAPDVLTYVIGVFEDEQAQLAQANLDTIAGAGQTGTALIIKTSQDVVQEFMTSLSSIREHSLACEYSIPSPTEGPFQHDLVNVDYDPGDGTTETVGYVGSPDGCGAGGWFYDVDPATGVEPTQIRLCPETCEAIQGNSQGSVAVRLGCPTVVVK